MASSTTPYGGAKPPTTSLSSSSLTSTAASTPHPSAASATSHRQSCDRCHGQKLRCIRDDGASNNASCHRCTRRGVRCVYSQSMPKGRPRNASRSNSRPVVSSVASRNPSTSSASTLDVDFDLDLTGASIDMMPDMSMAPPLDTLFDIGESQDAEMVLSQYEDLSQWLATHSPSSFEPTFAESFDLDAFKLVQQTNSQDFLAGHHPETIPGMDEPPSGSKTDRVQSAAETLTRLNLQLCALHRTALEIPHFQTTSTSTTEVFFDDSAIKIIVACVAQFSSGTTPVSWPEGPEHPTYQPPSPTASHNVAATLRNALQATHRLLDVLRELQVDVPILTRPFHVDPEDVGNAFFPWTPDDEAQGRMGKGISERIRCPINAGLVTSCHILLLNVFVQLLVALQHDANMATIFPSSLGVLSGIRPAIISQACAYIFEKQVEAVDLYLDAEPVPFLEESSPSTRLDQPIDGKTQQAPPVHFSSQEILHLRHDIRDRLQTLRQTLHGR